MLLIVVNKTKLPNGLVLINHVTQKQLQKVKQC